MKPDYSFDTVKYSTDPATFKRAVGIYQDGKIKEFSDDVVGFSAVVIGTEPYHVTVSAKKPDHGNCTCYLGQQDIYCKHMVAVALFVATDGKPLSEQDTVFLDHPVCSGQIGALPAKEVAKIKQSITADLRLIKPYAGPSRIWFAYQGSLQAGCNRLTALVSTLPASEQTAQILVDLLLRLDKKLSVGGVDDSDGTVGEFMQGMVDMLIQFAALDQNCKKSFHELENRETCFGWEEPLVQLLVIKKC